MFRGLTAWFSSSVDDSILDDWERYGGEVCEIDTAQFIFSNDSEEDDTKRLYTSEAYIKEHLAIFHSQFVKDCVKKGDRYSVVLGKYFLPPLTVRKLMKKKNMAFEWEVNEEKNGQKSQARGNNSSPIKSVHSSSQSVREKSPVKNNKPSSSPHKSTSQKYSSSSSHVYQPSSRKTSSSQKSHSSQKYNTPSQITSSNNKYQSSSSSSSSHRNSHSNQLDPDCQYVPINQLKKISGEILFFDPTDDDWEVFKIN